MKRAEAIDTLRQAGILNPLRLVDLIEGAIAHLNLDLAGLVVLTECASGPYVVTSVIAAVAGAERVIGLTADSRFATTNEVANQTRALEALCKPPIEVDIQTRRSLDLFSAADIVTNLGFVRPIDADAVAVMKSTAVLPLMCEAWEYRTTDVDLEACKSKGILAMGTQEDHPDLDLFAYVGWLALKLLFDAQIEVHHSRVAVLSSDRFGLEIDKLLNSLGILVDLAPSARDLGPIRDYDAIVVADYTRDDVMIGPASELSPGKLAKSSPNVTIVQVAGQMDVAGLRKNGITVYPGYDIPPHKMAISLAGLGSRPVVELHTAGLAVGRAMAEARLFRKLGVQAAIEFALANSPADPVPGFQEK